MTIILQTTKRTEKPSGCHASDAETCRKFSPRRMDRHSLEQNSRTTPTPRQRSPRDRIVLCIGGTFLQTSRQTLCVDSDSMLAAWVLRHLHDEDTDHHRGRRNNEDRDVCEGENDGRILWIDRDAHRFDHVLNYLRNGTIWLEDVASLRAVQEEAVFFGLSGLESLCEERIQALENLKKQHTDELRKTIHSAILDYCKSQVSPSINRGEVLAILCGRRLGVPDAPQEPTFRMDEDF